MTLTLLIVAYVIARSAITWLSYAATRNYDPLTSPRVQRVIAIMDSETKGPRDG